MIKSITLVNYLGEPLEITLTDPYEHGIYIENIEGLGYPQSTNHFTKIASNPVQSYNSTEISERNIVVYFGIIGNNDVEESRHLLYEYLTPGVNTMLVFKTDQRFVYTNAYIESVEPKIFEEQETVQVSFICGDPYFHDWHLYEQTDKPNKPNFVFSKWFFEEGLRPVSISKNEESILVNFNANNYDFSGFELAIIPIGTGFDKTVIEYSGGKITFNPNGMDYYFTQAFKNDRSFMMVGGISEYTPLNMFVDQNFDENFGYRMEPNHGPGYLSISYRNDNWYIEKVLKDSVENIEQYCTIEGDFPELKVGKNTFKIATFGFLSKILNDSDDILHLESLGLDIVDNWTYDFIRPDSYSGDYFTIDSVNIKSLYQLKMQCGYKYFLSDGPEKILFFVELDTNKMERDGFEKGEIYRTINSSGIENLYEYFIKENTKMYYSIYILNVKNDDLDSYYETSFGQQLTPYDKESLIKGELFEYYEQGVKYVYRRYYLLRFFFDNNETYKQLPIKITWKTDEYTWEDIFNKFWKKTSDLSIAMTIQFIPFLKRKYESIIENVQEVNPIQRIYLDYVQTNNKMDITIKKNNSYNAL